MLIMNGTADRIIPWHGGALGPWGGQGQVISTPETVAFWRHNNGCTDAGQERQLPDTDPNDGSTVTATQYVDCRSGAPVVLMAVNGGGHLPPGVDISRMPLIEAVLGRENHDVSAAEITWKFFRRFSATHAQNVD